jgi:hypothetical protein
MLHIGCTPFPRLALHTMPHTRSHIQKLLQQTTGQVGGSLQVRESSTDGWNEYLNWELPEFASREYSSVDTSAPHSTWYTNDRAIHDGSTHYAGGPDSKKDSINYLSVINFDRSSGAEFCGLQHWYSSATQDLPSESSEADARPQLADSAYMSYESTSLGEADLNPHQSFGTPPWPPKSSPGEASFDEATPPRKMSRMKNAERIKQLEDSFSPSPPKEVDRANAAAKLDTNKKRKIAHSLIEKNYRSRIKDGMAELRHCVPSTRKGTSSLESNMTETQVHADEAKQSHSSGKMATLSDAVRYVKSLELRNEALHGKLDVMQRRNDTLQKIALSKVDMITPPTDEATDELEQEESGWFAEKVSSSEH